MKKLLVFAILCLSCVLVYAQNSNELIDKLVEKNILTKDEADKLRSETSKTKQKESFTQKVDKVRNAFNTPYMQFGGNGQMMYKYSDVDDIHNDFKIKNLFISVNGKLNNSFRYGFLLEMSNPSVQEFWGEWTAAKEFNLKVGQFKSPFTLESQYVPATLETAAYSRTISNLVGYAGDDDAMKKQNGKNNFGRDAGIMASGELFPVANHSLLQYSVGAFQGTGVTTSETNNTTDFSGMLLLQPVKGLRIGGGAYIGKAAYKETDTSPKMNHKRNRWFLSADYKSERFNARAEWVNGEDGGIDKEGVYAMGMYYITPKKLNAVARVDYYNKDKNINNEVIDYTLGLNFYFYPQCRVMINYTYSDYSNHWGAKNSNVVLAQLQIGF